MAGHDGGKRGKPEERRTLAGQLPAASRLALPIWGPSNNNTITPLIVADCLLCARAYAEHFIIVVGLDPIFDFIVWIKKVSLQIQKFA